MVQDALNQASHEQSTLRKALSSYGPGLIVAAAFLLYAARMFQLISLYAVNIFFSDQWEFNDENIANGKIRRLTLKWFPDGRADLQFDETTISELYEFLNKIGSLQTRFSAIIGRLPSLEEVFKAARQAQTGRPPA